MTRPRIGNRALEQMSLFAVCQAWEGQIIAASHTGSRSQKYEFAFQSASSPQHSALYQVGGPLLGKTDPTPIWQHNFPSLRHTPKVLHIPLVFEQVGCATDLDTGARWRAMALDTTPGSKSILWCSDCNQKY